MCFLIHMHSSSCSFPSSHSIGVLIHLAVGLLTDASSVPRAVPFEFSGTISGPPSCRAAPEAVAPLLPGINGTRCERYPACVAVGIQGHCCPNRQRGTKALGARKGWRSELLKAFKGVK